ncbi:MAG: hypothetical protein KDD60_10395, partial [Bdellovibrionales bacterium]|nr:hypothetical protein [Bdellovibrionales bacterium]
MGKLDWSELLAVPSISSTDVAIQLVRDNSDLNREILGSDEKIQLGYFEPIPFAEQELLEECLYNRFIQPLDVSISLEGLANEEAIYFALQIAHQKNLAHIPNTRLRDSLFRDAARELYSFVDTAGTDKIGAIFRIEESPSLNTLMGWIENSYGRIASEILSRKFMLLFEQSSLPFHYDGRALCMV